MSELHQPILELLIIVIEEKSFKNLMLHKTCVSSMIHSAKPTAPLVVMTFLA